MFEGNQFPGSLDEHEFEKWLEEGRMNRIGYHYLCIIWDAMDERYYPVYVESRDEIKKYQPWESSVSRESLIAAYDLYSESRISV